MRAPSRLGAAAFMLLALNVVTAVDTEAPATHP